MNKAYLIFGTLLCLLLAYADVTGWAVAESLSSGQWTPQGQAGPHSGVHSFYHK